MYTQSDKHKEYFDHVYNIFKDYCSPKIRTNKLISSEKIYKHYSNIKLTIF